MVCCVVIVIIIGVVGGRGGLLTLIREPRNGWCFLAALPPSLDLLVIHCPLFDASVQEGRSTRSSTSISK